MKRSEFANEVYSWWQLQEFCEDNGCYYVVEDVIDEDALTEYLNDWLANTDKAWYEVRDYLADIPTDYSYYLATYDGYEGLSDYDFDDYCVEAIRYCDDNELWDPEDDDEEESSEPSGYESPSAYTPLEVRNGDNFDIQSDQLLQLACAFAV